MEQLVQVSAKPEAIPLADDLIDRFFNANDGYMAKAFKGFQPRAGQVALATAVDDAICRKVKLFAEAPCGTGKSIAYLAPATYYASQYQKTIVCCTANIALQEQLIETDLPRLQAMVPWKFTYALLKGRNNFVCRDKSWETWAELSTGHGRSRMDPDQYRKAESLYRWIEKLNTDRDNGDRSDYAGDVDNGIWSMFSSNSDECSGSKCDEYAKCFAIKHQTKARAAQVIVTNYHMLFADSLVRASSDGMASILPDYQVLIMDECHKVADIARDFFGFNMSAVAVRRACSKIKNTPIGRSAIESTDEFFDKLKAFSLSKEYKGYILEPLSHTPIGDAWYSARDLVSAAARELNSIADRLDASSSGTAYRIRSGRLLEFIYKIDEAMSLERDNCVYFVEIGKGKMQHASLRAAPIEVGNMINESVFKGREVVIGTSATMCSGPDGFKYIKRELGADDARTMVAESPYNWNKQALIVVPDIGPDTNDIAFRSYTAWAVEQCVRQARGRTLALFTSYASLESTYERLSKLNLPYRIMRQGELPRTKLIDIFRSDVTSVLLGTESFWTGVDVQGESLSCVVMDRLPFPSPGDPIMKALEKKYTDAFYRFSIPKAILNFKQGFGRLIRDIKDRGVFVLLDQRVHSKSYGKTFLKSLPRNIECSTKLESISEFLSADSRLS